MGSVTEPSVLETLLKKVSLQVQNSVKDIVNNDKHARETLLASMRQLTLALEAPNDVVNRLVFFPSTYICARVPIDLKLFDIIADAKRPISSAELASKTGGEEQLLVRILRGITFAGLVNEVGEQLYEANVATHHVKLPSIQAGMIHFYDQGLKSVWSMPNYFKLNGYKLPNPGLFILVLFTWAIGIVTTVTQFIQPPLYLLEDTHASLFYFAPIIGGIVGEFFGHFFNDFFANSYIKLHNEKYSHENRLWGAYVPCAFGIAATVLYGQTLQKELPLVGLGAAWSMMVFAEVVSTTAVSACLLNIFPHHAALASAWLNFWRTTGGFCVTYFQTKWVAKSGAAVTFGV